MPKRKSIRTYDDKRSWEFNRANVCLIITVYIIIIVSILSARAHYNKQLNEFLNKTTKISYKSYKAPEPRCVKEYQSKNGRDQCAEMPNDKFIFHNKIPKSGSTTFYNIVAELAKINDFDLGKGSIFLGFRFPAG